MSVAFDDTRQPVNNVATALLNPGMLCEHDVPWRTVPPPLLAARLEAAEKLRVGDSV